MDINQDKITKAFDKIKKDAEHAYVHTQSRLPKFMQHPFDHELFWLRGRASEEEEVMRNIVTDPGSVAKQLKEFAYTGLTLKGSFFMPDVYIIPDAGKVHFIVTTGGLQRLATRIYGVDGIWAHEFYADEKAKIVMQPGKKPIFPPRPFAEVKSDPPACFVGCTILPDGTYLNKMFDSGEIIPYVQKRIRLLDEAILRDVLWLLDLPRNSREAALQEKVEVRELEEISPGTDVEALDKEIDEKYSSDLSLSSDYVKDRFLKEWAKNYVIRLIIQGIVLDREPLSEFLAMRSIVEGAIKRALKNDIYAWLMRRFPPNQ